MTPPDDDRRRSDTDARRRAARPPHAPGGDGGGPARSSHRRQIDREVGEPLAAAERRLSPPAARPRHGRPLDRWPSRPRILITNDDGIESRGLLALRQALSTIGDTYVVAPETNQSGVGHGKTLMRPLRVRQRTLADGSTGWSVDGSPTDAVSLAFLGYFDVGFDLVASGINFGANLGDDVTYSGTVSAAMEAAINDCPAFAISQEYHEHPDFTLATRAARTVAVNVLEHGLSAGQLINVNVPGIPEHDCHGFQVTRMGKRVYNDVLLERLDPRGAPYYWIGGPPPSGVATPGTDFQAVTDGWIAVTPIQLDLTARDALDGVSAWPWELARDDRPVPAARPDSARDAALDEMVTAQVEPENERR